MNWIEIIGYLSSILIAVSLMMSNIFKLRLINLLGAIAFSVYGLIQNVYPVFLVNGWIALVDIYYLWQLTKNRNTFELIYVKNHKSVFLKNFLEFYKKDIKKFMPDFSISDIKTSKIVYIVRNMIPVGIFIFEPITDDTIEIKLDYTIPQYRDFQNARYLFSKGITDCWEKGYTNLISKTNVAKHSKYLIKIGFKQSLEDPTLYSKEINITTP